MKHALSRVTLSFFGLYLMAVSAPVLAGVERLFTSYAELLDAFVIERRLESGGLLSAFDYHAALADPITPDLLSEQRNRLAGFDPLQLDSRREATAFWLNAYNFFMIAHLLENRPGGELVDSVWDYGGRINPFRRNVFERELFEVGGAMMSLDQIEKDTLMGKSFRERGWADARVHFAINCAAVGCPPLRNTAYTSGNLDALLAENTRLAFNTPYQLRVTGSTLEVSRLFDGYEADFLAEADSIREFIAIHAGEEVARRIRGTTTLRFIDYDWRLNQPEHFPEIGS